MIAQENAENEGTGEFVHIYWEHCVDTTYLMFITGEHGKCYGKCYGGSHGRCNAAWVGTAEFKDLLMLIQ